jgi:lysozyme family protein
MSDFKISVTRLLAVEGGIVRDTDGITNFGICSKYNPGVDIETLTVKRAEDWYYDHYWLPMHLFSIARQEIADQLLDAGVNCGAETAIMMAQEAYNDLYPANALKVDGSLGAKTALVINALKFPRGYMNALIYHRVKHYLTIIEAHPEKSRDRVGWLNRI